MQAIQLEFLADNNTAYDFIYGQYIILCVELIEILI